MVFRPNEANFVRKRGNFGRNWAFPPKISYDRNAYFCQNISVLLPKPKNFRPKAERETFRLTTSPCSASSPLSMYLLFHLRPTVQPLLLLQWNRQDGRRIPNDSRIRCEVYLLLGGVPPSSSKVYLPKWGIPWVEEILELGDFLMVVKFVSKVP